MSSPVATLSLVLVPGDRKKKEEETHEMSFFSAHVCFGTLSRTDNRQRLSESCG